MPEDNVFTEIELVLKDGLEDPTNVSVGGSPVPVRIVTPDPDLVEITYPTTTLQLVDVRRGSDRAWNEFEVTKDEMAGTADVAWPEMPYDLHYTVRAHTESARQDRLLIEQYLRFVDAHPLLTGATGRRFLLSRSLSFRDRSRGRTFEKALTFVVKARIPVGVVETVPLALEHQIQVEEL